MKTRFVIVIFALCTFISSVDLYAVEFTEASAYDTDAAEKDPYELLSRARKIYMDDPAQALNLIEDAINIGLSRKDINAQAESYLLLGEITGSLNQHDLEARNYLRALTLFGKLKKPDKVIRLYKLLGKAYEADKIYEKALEFYQLFLDNAEFKSKSISSPINKRQDSKTRKSPTYRYGVSSDEIQEVQLAISEIYSKQKKFEESVRSLKEVVEKTDSVQNPEKLILLNDRIGDVYRAQNEDFEALNYYNSSRDIAEELDRQKDVGRANSKIAGIYSDNNRFFEALSLRNQSIRIYNLSGDTSSLALEYLEQGRLENKLNRLSRAENSIRRAMRLADAVDLNQVKREALKEMSSISEKKGEIQIALNQYKDYITLQDEAFMEKEAEMRAKLELNSTLAVKQQRIDLLEKNEEINSKTIDVLRENETLTEESITNQRLLIYGLLAVILLTLGSAYLMYKNMRQKRLANQLMALKSLRAQMNPHFIFNALNSVNHYISEKDERSANKYLSEFSRLMRAVLENSQEDFITLQKEIEIISLYLRLEHDRFKEKFDFELKVSDDLDRENIMIPPMLVQPFVENAVWHGLRYKEVKGSLMVNYDLADGHLVVTIEDNGIGRRRSADLKTRNQQKNASTGMQNIENRVRIINDMYSSNISVLVEDLENDGGTRVTLDLMLKAEPEGVI